MAAARPFGPGPDDDGVEAVMSPVGSSSHLDSVAASQRRG